MRFSTVLPVLLCLVCVMYSAYLHYTIQDRVKSEFDRRERMAVKAYEGPVNSLRKLGGLSEVRLSSVEDLIKAINEAYYAPMAK